MSIRSFISSVQNHGGLARTNRFLVRMNPPEVGAIDTDNGPVETTQRQRTNGQDITLLCHSCTLPGRSLTTTDYTLQKQAIKMPSGFTNEDVTLTFHVTNDQYIRDIFEKWFESIVSVKNYRVSFQENYAVDVEIIQIDQQDKEILKCLLKKAYPITMGPITLDNSSAGEVLKLEVTLTYSDHEITINNN